MIGTAAASSSALEMKTLDPTSITGNDAQLWGEVENLSSDDDYLSTHYFEYGIAGDRLDKETWERTCSDRFSRCPREGDVVDEWVHNLKPGTDYDVRVFGEANDGETDFGDVVTFTTAPGPEIDQFDVTTEESGDTLTVTVDWAVSHQGNGELDEVRSALLFGGFSLIEAEEEYVSGTSASGTHVLETDDDDADTIKFDGWDTDRTSNWETKEL